MKSKSAIELYFRCPKAYKFAYHDGYVSKHTSREVKMGLVGHSALEEGWSTGVIRSWPEIFKKHNLEDPVDAMRVRTIVEMDPRAPPADLEYTEEWCHFEELGIRGIADAVTPEHVYEHKFTSSDFSVDGMYWERLKSDWQAGMLQLMTGKPVMYNVFRIPQQRQGKSESLLDFQLRIESDIDANPGRYYARAKVVWSDESLARLQNDLPEVIAAMNSGVYPRSRKCFEFRRPCEYQPVCYGGHEFGTSELYQIKTRREAK